MCNCPCFMFSLTVNSSVFFTICHLLWSVTSSPEILNCPRSSNFYYILLICYIQRGWNVSFLRRIVYFSICVAATYARSDENPFKSTHLQCHTLSVLVAKHQFVHIYHESVPVVNCRQHKSFFSRATDCVGSDCVHSREVNFSITPNWQSFPKKDPNQALNCH